MAIARKAVAREDFAAVFAGLRAVLAKHAGAYAVTEDSATRFCLEAPPGPATIRAWRGTVRRDTIPIAWVDIGKAYVSFHLMGMSGNAALAKSMTSPLKARMQGKTCFNFKSLDAELLTELDTITARSLAGMKAAGFI